MSGIHTIDLVIIAAYLGGILYLGKRSSHTTGSEEGFFLAGRKLGKLYQFFLNFGNATDANGAVSTATLVYQQGASGVWLAFQTIFMNPYYWFMNVWFRRVRLVTVAELFEERLSSHNLSKIYALYQVAYVCLFIGWGNLVGYNVTASLLPKPESAWTVEERRQVEQYREFRGLEKLAPGGSLGAEQKTRLVQLNDLYARHELRSYISYLKPWMFYLGFTLVVGFYLWMGGMTGTARNEIFQGVLIVTFSILLIPFGFSALGGVGPLRERVPHDMLELLGAPGTEAVSWYSLVAITLVSIVQINGIQGNMGVSGSARNEYAARFGAVSGTYAKRLMIIMWAFVGLIGCGLYFGDQRLAEPDMLWGRLSRQLLAPGLFGLMLAGLLAAMMSNIATNSMASSALFVRNVYTYLAPGRTDKEGVKVGRLTIVVVLVVGMFVALTMNDVVSFIRVMLTVNAPWGAAILLMFFWRRLSRAAVWWCVGLSAVVFVVLPFTVQLSHTLSTDPALIAFTQPAKVRPVPMYFDRVVHQDPFDLSSPLVGGGRFNLEAWTLSKAGLNLTHMTGRDLQSVQFFFAAIFPFIVLVVASLLTRQPAREKVDWFFGKMKTPVGATPELEAATMEETRRNPRRFDHTKLFPSSNWEWTKWDKTDTVGFLICLGVSGGIIAMFWFLLRLTAGG
jgi:SSS family solute:Na+ symporter